MTAMKFKISVPKLQIRMRSLGQHVDNGRLKQFWCLRCVRQVLLLMHMLSVTFYARKNMFLAKPPPYSVCMYNVNDPRIFMGVVGITIEPCSGEAKGRACRAKHDQNFSS